MITNFESKDTWLDDIRSDLRKGNICLGGRRISSVAPRDRLKLDQITIRIREKTLCALERENDAALPIELHAPYYDGYENAVMKCNKALMQAARRGLPPRISSSESRCFQKDKLMLIWKEYDEILQWFHDWSGGYFEKHFEDAAAVLPYIGRRDLGILEDDGIAKTLQDDGIIMTLEHIRSLFKPSYRLYLARNHKRTLHDAVRRAGRNITQLLTDESILAELEHVGFVVPPGKMHEIFTDARRMAIAVYTNKAPLEAVQRIGRKLNRDLTDKNIRQELQQSGISTADRIQTFVRDKTDIAVRNKKPLKQIARIAANIDRVLTDAAIQETLAKKNIHLTPEQVQEIFKMNVKKRLAVSNADDPLRAACDVGKRIVEDLTDEHIAHMLRAAEIDMKSSEITQVFTPHRRAKLALKPDPIAAVQKIAGVITQKLTDDNIAQALRQKQHAVTHEMIHLIFTRGFRTYVAFAYENPMQACLDYFEGKMKYRGESLDDRKIRRVPGEDSYASRK